MAFDDQARRFSARAAWAAARRAGSASAGSSALRGRNVSATGPTAAGDGSAAATGGAGGDATGARRRCGHSCRWRIDRRCRRLVGVEDAAEEAGEGVERVGPLGRRRRGGGRRLRRRVQLGSDRQVRRRARQGLGLDRIGRHDDPRRLRLLVQLQLTLQDEEKAIDTAVVALGQHLLPHGQLGDRTATLRQGLRRLVGSTSTPPTGGSGSAMTFGGSAGGGVSSSPSS